MPPKTSDRWLDMLSRLKAFRKANGHCNVPTNYRKDPPLGRWLAMQRHKRKIDALDESRVKALDQVGFVWAPSDATWEGMLRLLRQFKQKEGHCNVPTKWEKNVKLADWVQRQRIWRKRGKLKASRVRQLDEQEFSWSIYKGCGDSKSPARKAPAAPVAAEKNEAFCSERLYRLSNGTFVQYSGHGSLPPVLQKYAERNRGELPPYIPLPARAVRFTLGAGWRRQTRLQWKGKGKIPNKVLEYVQDQGALPHYE